jgi:hypothetical protein
MVIGCRRQHALRQLRIDPAHAHERARHIRTESAFHFQRLAYFFFRLVVLAFVLFSHVILPVTNHL